MSLLKNPFAIRDGKVVVIDDLYEEERGLVCGCCCPYCGGEFEAKMGDIRIHHFSHVNNACDVEKAFITGLYKLFKQFLDDGNGLSLPDITLYCDLGRVKRITKENFDRYISQSKRFRDNCRIKMSTNGKYFSDNSTIVYDKELYPCGIITSSGNKKLLVIIQYQDVKFNTDFILQYEKIPSVKLNINDIDYMEARNTKLLYDMFNDALLYSWVLESIVNYKMPMISAKNTEIYNELKGKRQDVNAEEDKKWNEYVAVCRDYKSSRNYPVNKNNCYGAKYRDRYYYSIMQGNTSNQYSKTGRQILEKDINKHLLKKERQIELEKRQKETDKKIKSKKEQREKQLLPLKNYMKKYYADNNLGKPNLDNMYELYNFTAKFPDAENTLGKLEAELCIKNKMPPIDHWGHIWMTCSECGALYKIIPEKEDEIPTSFIGICDKCKE